ncbi:CGNR zinc finger domain-containing protein [Actinoplanes sp. ATCC 53533]|uniref:CGNR zinc finger domain-containing protein n=1 Tax=Actinoplanes sp. ATCC 53533 TaxID=1288362 RepID=UPI0035190280
MASAGSAANKSGGGGRFGSDRPSGPGDHPRRSPASCTRPECSRADVDTSRNGRRRYCTARCIARHAAETPKR